MFPAVQLLDWFFNNTKYLEFQKKMNGEVMGMVINGIYEKIRND